MKSELKKTKNFFRCVGTVNELALRREPCEVKLWKDGNVDGTVKGERIIGRVTVKTDKGVHTFDVYDAIRSDAEEYLSTLKEEEAKKFKRQINYFHMFEEMMNWTPAVGENAGPEPTLVNIEGSVAINDYVNQQGEISSGLRWNVRSASTNKVSPNDPTGTTLNATLYIDSIVPEMRNEEETGRLKVTLYGADNHGACFPVNAIVPVTTKDEDGNVLKLAEVFEDYFEPKMTVPFTFELTAHHVGGSKGGKKKFGKNGDVSVNAGFDVTELLLVGADDEIEEPEELTTEDANGNEVEVKTDWINPETMVMAKRERAKKLEEMKKNPPAKKGESSGSNLAAAKAQAKSGKFGVKSNVSANAEFDSMDDLDLPF